MALRRTHIPFAAIAVAAAAAAGCGSDDDNAKQAEQAPPPALLGTYSMNLSAADLPADPPPELTDRADRWTLKITASGGPNDKPALTLVNDRLVKLQSAEAAVLESSQLGVAGDRIVLHGEACSAGAPVESTYSWRRTGAALRLTVVKNGCADKVAQTLLTAHPWAKRS